MRLSGASLWVSGLAGELVAPFLVSAILSLFQGSDSEKRGKQEAEGDWAFKTLFRESFSTSFLFLSPPLITVVTGARKQACVIVSSTWAATSHEVLGRHISLLFKKASPPAV